jgi:phytoene dehydrogenase-like protein
MTLKRAADEAVPVRASVLDLGLRRLPRPRRTFGLGIDRPHYLSVHSAAASGLAPVGGATLNAARYTPVREKLDFAAVESELEDWADAVQPGWRGDVESRGFFPDLTVMTDFPRASNGGLPARPGIDAAGIPGVFIAGDWVGPEGLLSDAATASGIAAGAAAVAVRAVSKEGVGVA